VTPRTYLAFLTAYLATYRDKREGVSLLANNINVGLDKLIQATKDVDLMKIELKEKEKGLLVAQEKSAALLHEITASTAKAEKKKSEVQVVKDKANDEAAVIDTEKQVIDAQLLEAKPALDEADNALKAITAKDIGVLKQLKQPPNLIQRLFDCVLILLRIPVQPSAAVEVKGVLQLKDSWKEALPVMAQSGFLDSILKFDRDKINDEDVELLHPYLTAEDFTYDAARKASGSVAGLCTWIKAMVTYTYIAKVVKPKMAEQKVAEARLRVAMNKLQAAQVELDQCQAELDGMQAEFDEAMAAKQRIQADADATQNRMNAANKLIGGLAGEKARWTQQSEAFADEIRRLTGDVSIACAFMGYAGPFNSEFRNVLLKERFMADAAARQIPMTANLNVTSFMVDEGTVGDWAIEGLPSDELSVQNGIMVTRSSRWPLLIDPQGQGLSWIKTREEINQLRISTLTDKRFRNALEDSMAFGQPLLLENVAEEIDPILDPVLDKQVQKAGRGLKIVLADKECEYSEAFSLFLCSKMANPHFTPELSAQVTIIDFTVTMAGLEQQLLGRVVLKERAELEEQRQKLVEEVNSNQKTLKGLEDDLLYRLASSTGNLLDDTSLIEVLQNTKETSAEVQEKLETAELADQRISAAREEYRPVATRGSLLYFLIVDMAGINAMYQVSLQQFLALFDYSIEKSPPAPLASKRVVNIIEFVTFHTTCYMQRGFFERHKQIWSLMLTMKIELIAGTLSQQAVQVFLTGGAALDLKGEKPKPGEWMPDAVWLNVIALSRALPAKFGDLPDTIGRFAQEWRAWYDDDAPEQQKLPQMTLHSAFDLLLVVRSIRDDRMLLCAQDYIANTIGQKFIDSRPLDLREVEEEANCRCPIVAVLSQGSDPTAVIMELARKLKKAVRSISLGQGQEPAARKLISTGVTQGSWVMLQNCHLGLKFMLEIEQTMIKLEEIHPEFQLWVTSESHPKFPIGLLQMAIKITNEAPAGVRAGLKNSYAWVTQDMLDAQSQPQWKSMLYALCFMHTIVQERRKFGPLGFNIPYEFNQSDLSACVQYMQNHLSLSDSKKRPMDWDAINYMICDVQYGGRITDDWDRKLFNTYGQVWLSPVIFDASFRFHEGYKIPAGMEVSDYRKAVEKLALIDPPALFGLHANADLAFRTRQTQMVLTTITDVQPKVGGGGGGETREENVLRQQKALKQRLPNDYKKDDVVEGIKRLGGAKPLNICLQQEVDRLQVVLTVVRSSLNNLALAIAGTIVMSPDLTNTLDALYTARVPTAWTKASQLDAPNLGVWFSNIVMRSEQLTSWLQSGRPNCFWLTGFFNPQGFLTANRQEVCRKHVKDGWALDDVVNSTEVLRYERDEVRKQPDEGVHLYGLFIEGCRWDKPGNKLADSEPKVLFASMPVVLVSGQLASDAAKGGQNYSAPCYNNPKRTALNFIFAVDLRTEDPPSKWTLRGCCLLTSKDV